MIRLLLFPFAIVGLVLAIVVPIAWTGYFHVQLRPNWNPDFAYTGDVETQRHLASCFTTGCPHIARSRVLACAWREIILEESTPRSPDDEVAAEQACKVLSTLDRALLASVESDIRSRLHRASTDIK
jgi:hypothetical protein